MVDTITSFILIALVGLSRAVPIVGHSPNPVQPIHAPSSSQSSAHTQYSIKDLYKQAHQQLQLQAKAKEEANLKRKMADRLAYRKVKEDQMKKPTTIQRRPKALALGLHRDSPLPAFADKLTLGKMGEHAEMPTWKSYHPFLENGIIEEKDLPLQLQPVKDSFRFKQTAVAKTRGRGTPSKPFRTSPEVRTTNLQRKAKLEELGLHSNSALPAFAVEVHRDKLNEHPNIQDWHQYRKSLQDKDITEEELPLHFRPIRGHLRFKSIAARAKERGKRKPYASKKVTVKERSVPLHQQIQSQKAQDLLPTPSKHLSGDKMDHDMYDIGSDDEAWDMLRSALE